MNDHVDGWIPELVLGTLEGTLRTTVELHLQRCERCAAEAAATGEALSLLALALPPESPHPALRTGLLASIVEEQQLRDGRAQRSPFAPFIERLSAFFDITAERARALVELLADPTAWMQGPAEGVSLIHILPGQRFAGADAGFVRLAPGARFPYHRHIGREYGLILEGGFVNDDGVVVRAGERHELAAGTAHDFAALPEGCVFAALVAGGIQFMSRPSVH